MSKSIVELVDGLPTDSLTVKVLKTLDFVVPGRWQNLVGFDRTLQTLTGVSDAPTLAKIKDKAVSLYNDQSKGYQTAVWLYQTVDNTDKAIGAAALADKVGDMFSFVPFMAQLTPKAESLQKADFALKLLAEIVAYSKINGLTINPKKFASDVSQTYGDEALVRMVGLVALDGILPLGREFLSKIRDAISQGKMGEAMANSANFSNLNQVIPQGEQQQVVTESLNETQGWMTNIANAIGSRESIAHKFSGFIEVADDKMDFLAAFIDAGVNYFEHTGIQTVARSVIKKAQLEVG